MATTQRTSEAGRTQIPKLQHGCRAAVSPSAPGNTRTQRQLTDWSFNLSTEVSGELKTQSSAASQSSPPFRKHTTALKPRIHFTRSFRIKFVSHLLISKWILTIDDQVNPSVDTNSCTCTPAAAEVQPGVRQLHLQDAEPDGAVLQSAVAADPSVVLSVEINFFLSELIHPDSQQRQQLIWAQVVPGDLTAGRQVAGQRSVLPSPDHQGRAENGWGWGQVNTCDTWGGRGPSLSYSPYNEEEMQTNTSITARTLLTRAELALETSCF